MRLCKATVQVAAPNLLSGYKGMLLRDLKARLKDVEWWLYPPKLVAKNNCGLPLPPPPYCEALCQPYPSDGKLRY